MCLITACPKGTKKSGKNLEKWIRNGAISNSMGSGFAYKKNGDNKIYLSKAFFNVENLINAINDSKLEKDDELIIHHRIATSGSDVSANTHPFIVTHDFEEMTQLTAWTEKPVMAHNGVFSNYNDRINRVYNDTAHWIHLVISNPNFLNKLKENHEDFVKEYGNFLSIYSNKLAFLFPDRDMILIGDFKEDEGYFHSNGCYIDWRERNVGGTHTKTYSKGSSNILPIKSSNSEKELDFESQDYIRTNDCFSEFGIQKLRFTRENTDKVYYRFFCNEQFIKITPQNIKYFLVKKDAKDNYYHVNNLEKDIMNSGLWLTCYNNPSTCMMVFNEDLKHWGKNKIIKVAYEDVILDVFLLKRFLGVKLSKSKIKKLVSYYLLSVRKLRDKTKLINSHNQNMLIRTEALGIYLDCFTSNHRIYVTNVSELSVVE